MESNRQQARGILAIWNDRRADADKEYETWYRGEHLPERLSIPGFRASWRFRVIEGEPEYFTFYETQTPDVLFSEAYEAHVENPTPLTQRIMSSGIFKNATRALLARTAGWGVLHGAFAVSVRFDTEPPSDLLSRLEELASLEYVMRAECWKPARLNAPALLSAEQKLRGPDKSVSAAALVETAYEEEARAVAAALRNSLGAAAHIGVYRLFCSLHSADL